MAIFGDDDRMPEPAERCSTSTGESARRHSYI
jgi:hypothetical protein